MVSSAAHNTVRRALFGSVWLAVVKLNFSAAAANITFAINIIPKILEIMWSLALDLKAVPWGLATQKTLNIPNLVATLSGVVYVELMMLRKRIFQIRFKRINLTIKKKRNKS